MEKSANLHIHTHSLVNLSQNEQLVIILIPVDLIPAHYFSHNSNFTPGVIQSTVKPRYDAPRFNIPGKIMRWFIGSRIL